MTDAASPLSTNTHISFLNQVKTKVNLTYQKVSDFIKNNFLKLTGFTLVVGSYFAFGFEVSLIVIGAFATYQVALKLVNIYQTSGFSSQKSDKAIRKTQSLSVQKKDVVLLPDGRCLHDSVKWLKDYAPKPFLPKKQMRKEIGRQTLQTTEKLGVTNLFDLSRSELDTMQKDTKIVGTNIKTKEDEKKYFDEVVSKNALLAKNEPLTYKVAQKVEIIEGDTFDVALTLKNEKKYKNVAVLNMANQTSPGGGFLQGSSAQEEALCRRSNLFDSINIHPIGRDKTNFNPYLREKMKGSYQVPEFGAIYSPNILIYRGNQDVDGYAYLKNPEDVDVISSAAYDIAHGSKSKPANYRENTKIKLQMILNTALEKKQECVVLGAYGCGAFGNDPKEVTSIVKEILKERAIYQKEMKIVFAIIKDRNDKGNIENFSTLQNI
ncbi:MAG: hypothetical protein K1060chlam3_00345 [Candidatus Anoxychlamydiales bacterium]|nr:hypothetical protein [Candidatus Anoxychlamydiales bacterium]